MCKKTNHGIHNCWKLKKMERLYEEDQKENGSLQHELARLGQTCQDLENKNTTLR